MPEPLAVALVWHMHQPWYRDDSSGRFLLPWVRRRASKDYVRMIETALRFPELRVTMNFVPALLEQLEAYAGGAFDDRLGELCLRPTAKLSEPERQFLCRFTASTDHPRRVAMFEPFYRLLARVREPGTRLADHEMRDLQVWSELVWIDPADIRRDPALSALVSRGDGFDEEVKSIVAERQIARVRAVLPALRSAIARGVVEAITSPFAHPILPLLLDQDSALVARPDLALPPPERRFRQPGDALAQITRGRAVFERACGVWPVGMWPPECAVSPAAAALMASVGVRWAVSDEAVLARSLDAAVRDGPDVMARLYSPYRENGGLQLVFRDALLSNRIGFDYPSMPADSAVRDLVTRLEGIAAARPPEAPWLVVIALDGENCWDYYEDNGAPFLEGLYDALCSHPALRTVHVADHLARHAGAVKPLDSLWSGSWVDADFSTWIGEPAQTRAWELLAGARRALEAAGGGQRYPEAFRQALIAEGSDWFWWFGSRHHSGIDSAWDALYRAHLRRVYELIESPPPGDLETPLLEEVRTGGHVPPLRDIDPRGATGEEWLAAGFVQVSDVAGAMQPAASGVGRVAYGASSTHLHLRFGDSPPAFESARVELAGAPPVPVEAGQWHVAVPLAPASPAAFAVRVRETGRGEERIPAVGAITVARMPGPTVAVVAAECAPVAVAGDLALAVRATIDAIREAGRHCVVVLPHHPSLVHVIGGVRIDALDVMMGFDSLPARVWQGALDDGTPLLTVDRPAFFARDSIYGSVDDTERYVYFGRAAFELLRATGLRPAVLHGFEWESAIALALAAAQPLSAGAPVLSLGGDGVCHSAPAELCRAAGVDVDGSGPIDLLALARSSARRVLQGEATPRAATLDACYRAAESAVAP
jgi:alpha-amylase/alpha-mannosidase (GH57 family)